ncbi:MAG: biotin/lipoyl-containing protein [Eubacteriales bacterium]|nr:biotin/lipoyl-containing protein [Eubacteriales bacterium]
MDAKTVLEIIKTFRQEGLTELELKDGEFSLSLKAENQEQIEPGYCQTIKPESSVVKPSNDFVEDFVEVKAPLVGTFYQAPEVGAEPYVSIGQRVGAGDTLCIIEAMKMMNYIEAPCSGVIASIDVIDGDFVEFDQVIFRIDCNVEENSNRE